MSKKRKSYIIIMKALMYLSLILTASLTLFLIIYILIKGIPNISWKFLSTSPSYLSDEIGILPDILNTLYLVFTTVIIVIPVAVASAVYLNEYATNKKLVTLIERASQTLSAIPSIIYGLVGMLCFCEFFKLDTSLLAGSLTLVMMNIPTVMQTTLESLKTVDDSYRQGSYALGAGKWHMIRTVVLPNCLDGIVTGVILAIGRILGESAALLYTAGFAHVANGYFTGLKSAGASLTVAMYVYAKVEGKFNESYGIGAILMILTLLINLSVDKIAGFIKNREFRQERKRS